MLRYYFLDLQYKRINRHLRDFGLPPAGGYLLTGLMFVGLSVYLFYKTSFAAYLYALMALSFAFNLSETRRNDFLKICYALPVYWRLRLLENILVTGPFVLFLLITAHFLTAAILLLLTLAIARVPLTRRFDFSLPTPFSRQPFEFATGFRKTVFFVGLAYFLAVMAIWVNNFNLGIFALLLFFLISISYYTEPEERFYVWIHSLTPHAFLKHKSGMMLLHAGILSLPVVIGLLLRYPYQVLAVMGVVALGYLYLCAFLLAKYSAFPRAINLPQSLLLTLGLWFPPLLLGIIPFFYKQSIRNLRELLI